MRIPPLKSPERYVGLFVFDFGDHTSVGYTVEEIAMLRRQPRYANGVAYSVQAADESGRMELCGLSGMSFSTSDRALRRFNLSTLGMLSSEIFGGFAG